MIAIKWKCMMCAHNVILFCTQLYCSCLFYKLYLLTTIHSSSLYSVTRPVIRHKVQQRIVCLNSTLYLCVPSCDKELPGWVGSLWAQINSVYLKINQSIYTPYLFVEQAPQHLFNFFAPQMRHLFEGGDNLLDTRKKSFLLL